MSKSALVVIFNHRYEKNVPRLEAYYSPRFSSRHYLMPFARDNHRNVIGVVENGWCFSGHIAQGAPHFRANDVTHYVFLGDDLILNPLLDESNLVDALQLKVGAAYIKSLASADEVRFRWPWSIYASKSLTTAKFDYKKELPTISEATQKLRDVGITFVSPYPRRLQDWKWLTIPFPHRKLRQLHWNLKFIPPYVSFLGQYINSFGNPSQFPLVAGYSDFIVVPAENIDLFAHYCGVFAAMNMFAEVAVPTALALSCSSVQTELAIGDHFGDPGARRTSTSKFRGVEFWEEGIEAFCKMHGSSWSHLMENYPEDVLYYHPVKLSVWK